MSTNTMINGRRTGATVWSWRVMTHAGPIIISNCTVGEAVRKAGVFGPESVQPATVAEHRKAVQQSVQSVSR